MQLIPESLARWLRTRGHGVHSPFAFAFIADVLRESPRGYGYYAYPELNRLATSRREAAFARLLHRLVSRIPGGIGNVSITDTTPALAKAVEGAKGRYSLLVINDRRASSAAGQIIDEEETVVVIGESLPGLAQEIKDAMTRGMSFTSGHGMTIIIINKKLPLQHFSLSF